VSGFLRLPGVALSALLVLAVRLYQWCVRPFLPPSCRFEPGCSEYFILAVKKYGPVVGAAKGCWRVCRCGPWTAGGSDPP
jgi:putative membrane protein insertion efficiency factor